MKLGLIVLAFWLRAAAADANLMDFSGDWVGTSGQVKSDFGLSSSCSKIEIEIRQSEGLLLTEKYISTCDQFGSSWGPVREVIRDGRVYEGQQEVGTFDGQNLITKSQDGSISYLYNLRMSMGRDGQPRLQSVYGVQNYLGTATTEGELVRVSPRP